MKKVHRGDDGKFERITNRTMIVSVLAATIIIPIGIRAWDAITKPDPLISPIVTIVHAQEPQAKVIVKHNVEYTYDQVYDYVWMRESSRGKNNPIGSNAQRCYVKGEFNEIGASGTQYSLCFKSRDTQKEFFMSWMKKNMDGNIVGTLCRWNVGKRNQCEYGTTFLKEHSI